MRLRTFALLALATLLPAARADDKAKTPTLSLRVKGVDGLLSDLRYLAEQAGRDEELKQAERLLKRMTGDKGLEGLDTKKPIGTYGFLGAQGAADADVVLLLPIADQKTFLATLNRLNVDTDKVKDGVYTIQPQGAKMPAYFRFAHGYLYATFRDGDALAEKNLLKPDAVVGSDDDALALRLDLSDFPRAASDAIVSFLSVRVAALKEKKPGETQAQADFRAAALEDAVGFFKSLLTESGVLTARFGVDRKAGEVTASLGLAGRKGSELAKTIAGLGRNKSVAAAVVGGDSATATRISLELPEGSRKGLTPVIDEGIKKMLDSIKDEGQRDLLEPLIKSVVPTLKQARLDAALDFRGPSQGKTYTVVGAAAVKGGAAIDKQFRAAVRKLPPQLADQVTLDAAKVGDVGIHKMPFMGMDQDTRKLLGDDVFYFALRDDALIFALGEGALPALKEAVKTEAKASPLMQVDVSWARIAPLMAPKQKAAPKAAEEAFKAPGSDRVSLSLAGGDELRFKLSIKGPVLRFLSLLDAADKEQ